jgi:hypothetical protein
MIRIRAIAVLSAILLLNSRSAEDFRSIGSFANVRASRSEDPHCYGYSLELWRHDGQIVGLLDHHNGLCGDPPCEALRDVTHDRRTGRLTFSALDQKFVGTLRRDDVVGTLNGDRVRLARDRDWPMDGKADESFANWCEFWRGVRRCRGVDQVCSAQEQPGARRQ